MNVIPEIGFPNNYIDEFTRSHDEAMNNMKEDIPSIINIGLVGSNNSNAMILVDSCFKCIHPNI